MNERILARDPMEEIRRAFQLFDDDNTGKITLRNLRRVAKEIGDRLEDDELYVAAIFFFLYTSIGVVSGCSRRPLRCSGDRSVSSASNDR